MATTAITNLPIDANGKLKTEAPLPAGVTSRDALNRIVGDRERLAERGYKLPETVYTEGHEAGAAVERLKVLRREFDAQPSARDALEKLDNEIAREGRHVIEDVRLSDITCGVESGDLMLGGGRRVTPSRTALQHLASLIGGDKGLTGFLPNVPADLRATLVNRYVAQFKQREEVEQWRTTGLGKPYSPALYGAAVKARAPREGHTRPTPWLYRLGSSRYTPFEVGDAITALRDGGAIPTDARAEIDYDGDRTRIRLLWHADHTVDFACGDVFKVGVDLLLDDAKGGSIVVRGIAWRNLCLNLIIIGTAERVELRRRHVGIDVQAFSNDFVAATKRVQKDFAEFTNRWGAARKDRLIAECGGDVKKVMQGVVEAGLVDLPGRKQDKVALLMAAYEKEPGTGSKADVINAITRAAHEGFRWKDSFAIGETEAQAGSLLFLRNLKGRVEAGMNAWSDKYEETVAA